MANCKVLTSGPHFLLLTCPKTCLQQSSQVEPERRGCRWGGYWGVGKKRILAPGCCSPSSGNYCMLAMAMPSLLPSWQAVKLLLVYFKLWKICANARQPADITQWYLTRPNTKEQPFLPPTKTMPGTRTGRRGRAVGGDRRVGAQCKNMGQNSSAICSENRIARAVFSNNAKTFPPMFSRRRTRARTKNQKQQEQEQEQQ